MSATIELENAAPLKHLSIPIQPEGGITVLVGRNGVGKSRALQAIESAATGRGRIDVTDGQAKGSVDLFGVRVTFGRSTRRSGELEVETLEGRFSISDFVDPGLKSPEAADAKRIKVLAALSATKPDPSLFWRLLGGKEKFDSIVGTLALASDDIVQMADRVKRDIESAARKQEDQASHAEGRARGAREAAAGIDVTLPCDADELQTSLEAAIREESQITEQAAAAVRALRLHREAKDALEDAEASYTGPTLDEAEDTVEEARQRVELTTESVTAAKLALANAEMEAKAADMALRQSVKQRANAEQHEKMVAIWREQVAKDLPAKVSPERAAWATQQVKAAREAVEAGVLVRKAKQHMADSQAAAEEATYHRELADELREAAKGTDEVLTQLISKVTKRLRVESGRFVLETKRGPSTFFHDLSKGEKTKIGCDIGIDAVGRPGLLYLGQELWEGLDPIAQTEVAEHVHGRGVNFLTAKATADEEIRAEVFA